MADIIPSYYLQIGTFNIALAAKAFNKPVYVVVEFFKFARFFPLSQKDLPQKFQVIHLLFFFFFFFFFF